MPAGPMATGLSAAGPGSTGEPSALWPRGWSFFVGVPGAPQSPARRTLSARSVAVCDGFETLAKLHTPAPGEPKYAMGWMIADGQPWAGGPALTHSGSNTLWMAVAWLAPAKDFAVLVACNQASEKACNDAVLALIADHFKGEGR